MGDFLIRMRAWNLFTQEDKSRAWGAYHLTENFGNTGWKVNGKVTFWTEFQPKIEEYVLR